MHDQVPIRRSGPNWIVRYTYYTFLFSMPLEEAAGAEHLSITKLSGFVFMFSAAIQPGLCFRFPPNVFFLLFLYVLSYLALGIAVVADPAMDYDIGFPMVMRFITLVQLLVLFWTSYNLLRYENVARSAWLAVGLGTICLAILHLSGVAGQETGGNRLTSFGANPNTIATVLAIGMLALVGLAYADTTSTKRLKLLLWLCSAFLVGSIVSTGSRGPMLGLLVGMGAIALFGKSLKQRLRIGAVSIVIIAGLGWISYSYEPVRVRWERTLVEGEVAGRDRIFSNAWAMALERPFTGWGPVYHYYELGSRIGGRSADSHNLYLWVFLETGLLGAIPFFAGLCCCWRAALRAHSGRYGVLPLALLGGTLVMNMSGTGHNRKLFWVVLAYAAAAGSSRVVSRQGSRQTLLAGRKRCAADQPVTARSRNLDHAVSEGLISDTLSEPT